MRQKKFLHAPPPPFFFPPPPRGGCPLGAPRGLLPLIGAEPRTFLPCPFWGVGLEGSDMGSSRTIWIKGKDALFQVSFAFEDEPPAHPRQYHQPCLRQLWPRRQGAWNAAADHRKIPDARPRRATGEGPRCRRELPAARRALYPPACRSAA